MTDTREAPVGADPWQGLRRIVTGALIGCGVLLFGSVALREAGVLGEPPEHLRLTPLAVGVAFAEVAGYLFMPGLLTAAGRDRIVAEAEARRRRPRDESPGEDERLAAVFSGSRVVGLVLMGGASVFLVFGYLVEGCRLLPPLALLTLWGIAQQYPSARLVAEWTAEQKRRIAEQRARQDEDGDW